MVAACTEYLKEREAHIWAVREELIQAERSKGWPWFRVKTREEAIRRLKADAWGPYNRIEWQGSYEADRVRALRTAAGATGAIIYTSVGDVMLIHKHYPKKVKNDDI